MSSGRWKYDAVFDAVVAELGQVGTQSVLLNQAIAGRLGLNATEVEVLDWLSRAGVVTAGKVAEVAGLTSGATSRLIDRLEQAGYVHRKPNPKDRRSVLVEAVEEAVEQRLSPLYAPLERALSELLGRYDADELEFVRTFLRRVNETTGGHLNRLRSAPPRGARAADPPK